MRGAKAAETFKIKRIYEQAGDADGFRVLVDRLWPRGIAKERARVDLWLKVIAPSDGLRRRFHGEPAKWREFVTAYRKELRREPARAAAETLSERATKGAVTLLYAAMRGTTTLSP